MVLAAAELMADTSERAVRSLSPATSFVLTYTAKLPDVPSAVTPLLVAVSVKDVEPIATVTVSPAAIPCVPPVASTVSSNCRLGWQWANHIRPSKGQMSQARGGASLLLSMPPWDGAKYAASPNMA